jgi:hypothetical protein
MPVTISGDSGITTPDLTDTSLTSGRVVYAGASGNLTGSTALTFDGTKLQLTGTTATNTTSIGLGGSTTGYQRMLVNNTSGGAQFGIEGSTASTITTGSSAYATVVGDYAGYPLQLITGNVVRATVDTSGNVKLSNNISVGNATPTTSGTGITFPATQSASSDANTLDDYEEGTWTPVLARTGSNYTFSFQAGSYVKIGSLVTCSFSINISAITTQGSTYNTLSGLPFTPKNQFSGNLRYTGSLAIKAPLTSANSFYYSGAFFFNDGTSALQVNFTTGEMFGVITFEV